VLEIDWNIVTVREMQEILTEHNGYIDGDKKKLIVDIVRR